MFHRNLLKKNSVHEVSSKLTEKFMCMILLTILTKSNCKTVQSWYIYCLCRNVKTTENAFQQILIWSIIREQNTSSCELGYLTSRLFPELWWMWWIFMMHIQTVHFLSPKKAICSEYLCVAFTVSQYSPLTRRKPHDCNHVYFAFFIRNGEIKLSLNIPWFGKSGHIQSCLVTGTYSSISATVIYRTWVPTNYKNSIWKLTKWDLLQW